MRKSFWRVASLALVLSLVVCNANAAIWYRQNFDNLADGDMAGQDGWQIITADMAENIASPTVQSAVVHGTSGKALKVEAGQEVMRHFDPLHTGDQFLIIYFRKEDASDDNTLHIYMGKDVHEWPAGPVLRIGSQSGDPGQVGAHDGGDVKPVAAFVPGQWHKIRIAVSYDALNYNAYLDGDLIAEDFKFRKDAHDALGWLMIGFDAGVGVLGYYDDIIMGDGDGADVTAVDSEGKLATTWAALKR
jgi:hypothetical protein